MPGMRSAVVMVALASGSAFAQPPGPRLPATPPTMLAQPRSLPTVNSAQWAGRPAKVVYAGGQLQVTAGDSSLNQILRSIERQTGMKIAGGVVDERVYGNYGPAPTAQVLAQLLEGTGSNMVLRETGKDAPLELVLSPRNGGVTPPSPDMAGLDDPKANEPPAPTTPAPAAVSDAASSGAIPQPAPVALAPPPPVPTEVGGMDQSDRATTAQAAGDSAPASPNGVKTPQQIYQQLIQLQQQQSQRNPK